MSTHYRMVDSDLNYDLELVYVSLSRSYEREVLSAKNGRGYGLVNFYSYTVEMYGLTVHELLYSGLPHHVIVHLLDQLVREGRAIYDGVHGRYKPANILEALSAIQ